MRSYIILILNTIAIPVAPIKRVLTRKSKLEGFSFWQFEEDAEQVRADTDWANMPVGRIDMELAANINLMIRDVKRCQT